MTKVFRSFKPRTQQRAAETARAEDEGRRVNSRTGEVGGPSGPEPTRYGDWERGGICYDF